MEQTPPKTYRRSKSDQIMKRILRAFRRHLKEQYREMYDRRYYYWIPTTVRRSTYEFYREAYPDISYNDYHANENTLLRLIHSAKKQEEKLETIVKSSNKEDFSKNLRATFGQKPNKANLTRFFADPIVKKLWFSDKGFL